MSREFPYIGSIGDDFDEEDYEFSIEDIQKLAAIKSGSDIKTLVVGADWHDDHEICVNVTVNGVEFSALWIVPEFYADIIYAGKGVQEGKDAIAEYINDFMKDVDVEEIVNVLRKRSTDV